MEVELCWNCCVRWPNHCSAYCEVKLHQNHYGVIALRSSWVRKFQLQVICKSSDCECYGMRLWHLWPFHFQSCFLLNLRPYLAPREKWSPDYGSASDAAAWVKCLKCLNHPVSLSTTGTTKCATECEVCQSCKVSWWKRTCASVLLPFSRLYRLRDGNLGSWQAETADLQQKVSHQQEELLQAWTDITFDFEKFDHLISGSFAKCQKTQSCIWILWHIVPLDLSLAGPESCIWEPGISRHPMFCGRVQKLNQTSLYGCFRK